MDIATVVTDVLACIGAAKVIVVAIQALPFWTASQRAFLSAIGVDLGYFGGSK